MSTDNVTAFPGAPPPKPKKAKKPRIGLQFSEGGEDEPSILHVYQGLRGVCHALDEDSGDISRYAESCAWSAP